MIILILFDLNNMDNKNQPDLDVYQDEENIGLESELDLSFLEEEKTSK